MANRHLNLSAVELHRSATGLLDRYGNDAVVVAEMQAESLLADGDMNGYRTWKRLLFLVDGLLEFPSAGDANFH